MPGPEIAFCLAPMQKKNTWMAVGFVICVSAMVGIHWRESHEVQRQFVQSESLAERQRIAASLIGSLEKYRRLSGSFRRLGEGASASAKSQLKTEMTQGIERLAKLDPIQEERDLSSRITERLTDLMVLSAKYEPQLYLRDVYQRPEAHEIHDSMVSGLIQLGKNAKARGELVNSGMSSTAENSMKMLLLAATALIAIGLLAFLNTYLAHVRPMSRLRKKAEELKSGKIASGQLPIRLNGAAAEIASIMDALALTVERQQNERQQFITAVACDLRAPLLTLQTSANLLAIMGDKLDERQRLQASDAVKRSVFRLSKTLEDLTEITDIDRMDIRLDEKIVDVRDLVSDVARNLGGAGASHEVSHSVPSMPIWTLLDPKRFERVLLNLISKMMQYLPQGGQIEIGVKPAGGGYQGLEIAVQDGKKGNGKQKVMSGPEQDLLKHWVSENGFGMAMAHKIVRAHGGSVTASGTLGSSVVFTIRIPQERIATGLVSSAAVAARAGAFEGTRLETVLSKKAINFGS